MRFTLLFIIVLHVFTASYCIENLEFERLNSNNGLLSEEIRDIFQDSEGYLWFLTPEGLNKFDGYDFKIYKPGQQGLNFTTSAFESICEDKQKRLWLGTAEKGILIYDKANHVVIPFEEISNGQKLLDLHIRTLLADMNNNIWIGTEYGLYRFQIENKELTFFNLGNMSAAEPAWCIIESMIEDSKGNIWIGTWNMGLFRFNTVREQFSNFNLFDKSLATNNSNRIKSLYEDRHGAIWVGTWEDGLYEVRLSGEKLVTGRYFLYDNAIDQSIPGDIIYSINQDANDNIWIGTPYGLCIIENPYSVKPFFRNISHDFKSSKGLSNNEVWKIIKDKSGLMWLGTIEGGVNKVHPDGKIFENYTIPPISQQIYSQTIQNFCIDPDDRFLIGVKSLGFGYYDLAKKQYIPFTALDEYNSLPTSINTVNCFLNESDKYLWLGTRYNGLIRFDYNDKTWIIINDLSEQFTYEPVNVIFQDKTGNLWTGTENGLYKINSCGVNADCFEIERISDLDNCRIHDIKQDQDGSLWIGTAERGIYRFNPEVKTRNIKQFNLTSGNTLANRIQSIYVDSKDNLWAGTSDRGLLIYDRDKSAFTKARITEGMTTDMVFGMTEDANNNLWLTTNKGLIRLIHGNNNLVADSYTVTDGLQGNIFVRGSIFKQNNNRIFVGGYYGFNAFFPSDVKPNTFEPPTAITEIRINEEPVHFNPEVDQPIKLNYTKNNLEIDFSAMSFYKPDKNSYAYKLEGYDDDWQYVDASLRRARYPRLDAGSYIFYVKSANSSDLWNQQAVKVEFSIMPAPYKTWWAYIGYVVAFMLLLLLIYRFVINNLKMKHDLEIEKIEHAKSEKINQFKLRFFTNISHEILTPLSIINVTIDLIKSKTRKSKEELKIVERNVSQLNRLLHQLLDYRKMETGQLKLQVQKENFNEFITQITENFQPLANRKNLTLNLVQNRKHKETWFDKDKLDKIIDNLISNALKYTPDGGSVLLSSKVKVYGKNMMAEISVSDTGKGIRSDELENIFNRFYRSETEREDTGSGIGLAFTKNLVELHKGTISVRSEVGKGSTFEVVFPVDKESYIKTEIIEVSGESQILNPIQGNNLVDFRPGHLSGIQQKNTIKLLLVDDNHDFRSILKTHFKHSFNIIEAKDGKQGLNKAIYEQPDIIVSDVMMPEKDGFELCIDLKNNVDTKHIPVILLTAKVDEEARLKGYGTGADSYITKPLSLAVLHSRINALLLKNKDLLVDLSTDHTSGFKKTKMTDPLFLKEIEHFVLETISESELSVRDIAKYLNMSDSMFYRRVKQLAKVTPVEYVKNIRLNQAARMLKKEDATIAEIAYSTGFSDQSYFTVCFKKKFGITPRNYIKKQASV